MREVALRVELYHFLGPPTCPGTIDLMCICKGPSIDIMGTWGFYIGTYLHGLGQVCILEVHGSSGYAISLLGTSCHLPTELVPHYLGKGATVIMLENMSPKGDARD